MKQLLVFLPLMLLSWAALAQKKPKKLNQKKPDAVALAYYRAIMVLDFETAKQVSTQEGQELLSFLENMLQMNPEERSSMIQEGEKELALLKKAKCQVKGDEATCSVCCVRDEETGKNINADELVLRRQNGLWFVHFDKGDADVMEEPLDPSLIEPRLIEPRIDPVLPRNPDED